MPRGSFPDLLRWWCRSHEKWLQLAESYPLVVVRHEDILRGKAVSKVGRFLNRPAIVPVLPKKSMCRGNESLSRRDHSPRSFASSYYQQQQYLEGVNLRVACQALDHSLLDRLGYRVTSSSMEISDAYGE